MFYYKPMMVVLSFTLVLAGEGSAIAEITGFRICPEGDHYLGI